MPPPISLGKENVRGGYAESSYASESNHQIDHPLTAIGSNISISGSNRSKSAGYNGTESMGQHPSTQIDQPKTTKSGSTEQSRQPHGISQAEGMTAASLLKEYPPTLTGNPQPLGGLPPPAGFFADNRPLVLQYDDGLPASWHRPDEVKEAGRTMLAATDLIWSPRAESRRSPRGISTGRALPHTFLCSFLAKKAIATGVEYHLQQMLAGPGYSNPLVDSNANLRVEPESFVALLHQAGVEAIEAWRRIEPSSSIGGNLSEDAVMLAVSEAVTMWNEEQRESHGEHVTPLFTLLASDGGPGAAPVMLVRA